MLWLWLCSCRQNIIDLCRSPAERGEPSEVGFAGQVPDLTLPVCWHTVASIMAHDSTALFCLLAATCIGTSSLVALAGGAGSNAVVTVFAASSATDALTVMAGNYEAKHRVRIRFSFAASSVLARQIEQDAPCDVFLSADQKWMDYLAEKGRIQAASRRDIAGNRLVIVTPARKPLAVLMVKGSNLAAAFSGRLALGDPDHVPAGIYAKEAMQSLGWWDSLKNRLLPAENVRAALKLVEMGEADVGIVYASDARSSSKVAVCGEFPEVSHSPIRYPAALCVAAGPEAKDFLDFMAGEETSAVWTAAGFVPLVR
jgi:molybdate transport system substrate-binding protein